MKQQTLHAAVLVLILTIGLPSVSLANHITANIGGTDYTNVDSECNNCLYLDAAGGAAKSYGSIKIAANDYLHYGRARVEVTSSQNDASNDWIALKNVKITTTTAFTNEYRIAFWSTFNNDPYTDALSAPTKEVTYQLILVGGTLKNGAVGANGATVRAKQSIQYGGTWYPSVSQNLPSTPPQTITNANFVFFGNPNNTSFQWGHNPELNGARVLQGEFWFTMPQATDTLLLPGAPDQSPSGLIVQNVATQEPPCPLCVYLNWIVIAVLLSILAGIINFIMIWYGGKKKP